MRGARRAAWALVVLGVLAGVETAPPPHGPARHDGFTILAGDFHVHSFPGDGALPPWDIAAEAARRGLDVVALTNHNHLVSWRLAQIVPVHHAGAMLIPGVELTAVGYHMAAVGITATVPWRQPAAAAAGAIHALGGVAIASHPGGSRSFGLDAAAIDAIDGFESAHPMIHEWERSRRDLAEFRERAIARRPSLASIGSSDFHHFAPIGFCRTFVFASEVSQAGVLDAIRHGRTVACDGDGRTYGPPALSAAVGDACARASAGQTSWRMSPGAWAIWLGFLALAAIGADEGALK